MTLLERLGLMEDGLNQYGDGPMVTDPNGYSWDSVIDFLHSGRFKFCGCGNPEDNLAFVRDGLAHIHRLKTHVWTKQEALEEWMALGQALFGSQRSESFFYYWADKENLTEHGSGMPGWLTDTGIQAIVDISEALATLEDKVQ